VERKANIGKTRDGGSWREKQTSGRLGMADRGEKSKHRDKFFEYSMRDLRKST
jgi:hypothetical protein